MVSVNLKNPAETYTLNEFISKKNADELTYKNFAIVENHHGIEIIDHNLITDYLDELKPYIVDVELTPIERNKYRYAPDLLSYDAYGTTQLDFLIMIINDMVDPKEFDLDKVKMLYNVAVKEFMSDILTSNAKYMSLVNNGNGISESLA